MREALMHVALDMDDVVVDFEQGILRSIQIEYGVELQSPEWTPTGSTLSELGREYFGRGGFWGWMKERDWVWATFQPVPGAIGGIRRLRQDGHTIELVTSKPEWAEPQVWRWLGKWRPPVNRVTLMRTDEGTKAEACPTADILIDDRPANCQSFLDDGRMAVLFDRSNNRYVKGMTRVRGWAGVLSYIRDIYSEEFGVRA
jgi:hypothetical protein